jgi:hypothetical protein
MTTFRATVLLLTLKRQDKFAIQNWAKNGMDPEPDPLFSTSDPEPQ